MKIDIEITYLGEDVNVSSGASQMVVAFEFYDGNFPSSSGGGAVDSVNGKTGTVVLGANDINESSTRFWLTDVLKTAYDGAVSGLSNKVDKVTGKGLSENDYITADKNKLDGIQSGAEVNVNADWNATSGDAEILNKPTIPDTSTFALKSEVATVLFKSITQTIVTGKSLETSIYAIPLPMDGFDYMLKVYSQAQISTFAGLGITQRLRVGSYASPIDGLTGANSIGLQTIIANNGVGGANQCPVTRNFIWRGGVSGSIYGISLAGNIPDDGNSLAVFSTLATKDFTTQHYLYVTFNPSVVGAVVLHNQILVTLIKI